jgi:hypothetical protein
VYTDHLLSKRDKNGWGSAAFSELVLLGRYGTKRRNKCAEEWKAREARLCFFSMGLIRGGTYDQNNDQVWWRFFDDSTSRAGWS